MAQLIRENGTTEQIKLRSVYRFKECCRILGCDSVDAIAPLPGDRTLVYCEEGFRPDHVKNAPAMRIGQLDEGEDGDIVGPALLCEYGEY